MMHSHFDAICFCTHVLFFRIYAIYSVHRARLGFISCCLISYLKLAYSSNARDSRWVISKEWGLIGRRNCAPHFNT